MYSEPCTVLLLQRIVPPVLQRPITATLRVHFRPLLLRQMSLAVRHHPAHMLDVVVRVSRWVPRGVARQDVHDLAATLHSVVNYRPHGSDCTENVCYANLSCPMVSPLSPCQPEDRDCSSCSQVQSSSGPMLTREWNSLFR